MISCHTLLSLAIYQNPAGTRILKETVVLSRLLHARTPCVKTSVCAYTARLPRNILRGLVFPLEIIKGKQRRKSCSGSTRTLLHFHSYNNPAILLCLLFQVCYGCAVKSHWKSTLKWRLCLSLWLRRDSPQRLNNNIHFTYLTMAQEIILEQTTFRTIGKTGWAQESREVSK